MKSFCYLGMISILYASASAQTRNGTTIDTTVRQLMATGKVTGLCLGMVKMVRLFMSKPTATRTGPKAP